jgi:hypothetical protein
MSGPSEQAVEAAAHAMAGQATAMIARREDDPVDLCRWHRDLADAALITAHNPALGEDASVRLGDVLDLLRRQSQTATVGRDLSGGNVIGPSGMARAVDLLERAHREGRL